MDSEFSGEENAFRRELEAFGDANRSGDVMDHNPEQLSQTVDRSAKRGLMADRQGVGGFGRGHHGAGGATQAGHERCALHGPAVLLCWRVLHPVLPMLPAVRWKWLAY